MHQVACKNCGETLTGKFCSNCGEKVYSEADKKISKFLEESFHFITHFEGKFFTTLKTVFTRPGKLSLDYCNGIRKKYFKPLSLFLVIVVLYLLFPKYEGLKMSFETYLNKEYKYSWYALPAAKYKLQHVKISGNELAAHYNEKSAKFAKPFLMVLLPLSALLLWALFFIRRKLFYDHFVLSIELNAFMISLQFLLVPLLETICKVIYAPSDSFFSDDSLVFQVLQMAVMLLVTIAAVKRFYDQSWLWTVIKSVVFLALYLFVVVDLYKMLLYLCTLFFI